MNITLLLLAVALVVLAIAVLAWRAGRVQQQRQANTEHLQQQLAASSGLPAVATGPDIPDNATSRSEQSWIDSVLIRAGLRTGWKIPVILAVGFVVLVTLTALRTHNGIGGIVMAVVYVALVAFFISWRIHKRQRKLVSQLPDFLENMVRLTSIGQSLPMAFQAAATQTEAPLDSVMGGTLRRLKAGVDLEDALHQSTRGYRIQELDLLESVIRMSSQYGGRTDLILQRMSDFMRDLEQAQQELKSITSETRMASWVLGLLPLLVSVAMMLINPVFYKPMFNSTLGHELIALALILEFVGAFLLYRLGKSL